MMVATPSAAVLHEYGNPIILPRCRTSPCVQYTGYVHSSGVRAPKVTDFTTVCIFCKSSRYVRLVRDGGMCVVPKACL